MGAARERKGRLGGWLPPEESFGSAMGWESRSLLLGGRGAGLPHSFVTPFFASALVRPWKTLRK